MSVRRGGKSYKNDVDRRMLEIVTHANADVPEMMVRQLSLKHVPAWIELLRQAETNTRRTRKRLEALLAGDARTCPRPECGRPVVGRADATYCSSRCRLIAHRAAKRVEPSQPE